MVAHFRKYTFYIPWDAACITYIWYKNIVDCHDMPYTVRLHANFQMQVVQQFARAKLTDI